MSARPLAAFGTMMRTGLFGYPCPEACGAAARIARASPARAWRARVMRSMIMRAGIEGGSHMKRDVVEIGRPERPVRKRVSAEEWRLRCELAAAHRLVAHFLVVDMTYNHISVRVPGQPERFLVKADNVFIEQGTAPNLAK